MSERLFSVPKIPLFLDDYKPGTEKRRGDDVPIVTLTLRVQPFDATLATAIDDGLGGDSGVKAALFRLTDAQPKPHLDRVNLSLGCPRQNLEIFASSDTETPRLSLLQCKISGTYARRQKDIDGYAFVFRASVGPVGREELEFVHRWFLSQRAVSFEASEPSMEFDEEDDDEEVVVGPAVDGRSRPVPMWDDDTEPFNAPVAHEAAEDAPPVPKKRGRKKTAKHDPEAERSAQTQHGKANGAAVDDEGVTA